MIKQDLMIKWRYGCITGNFKLFSILFNKNKKNLQERKVISLILMQATLIFNRNASNLSLQNKKQGTSAIIIIFPAVLTNAIGKSKN